MKGSTFRNGGTMNRFLISPLCILFLTLPLWAGQEQTRQRVEALYIPLADHYAAIVAYEKYRSEMQFADFRIVKMKTWDLLKAHFQNESTEMAFVMAPLAIAMFQEHDNFRWIGLMHRDGSAMAVNQLMRDKITVDLTNSDRHGDIASALVDSYMKTRLPTEIGVPHALSTHNVILYKYLTEQGITLSTYKKSPGREVTSITVAPPRSPAFLHGKTNQGKLSAFVQSLPWAKIVEYRKFGHTVWYSKEVMPWPEGHVECIMLAKDEAISKKEKAIKEVVYFIRKAGRDIEDARKIGGESLDSLISMIRKHLPEHSHEAIAATLDHHLHVINYNNLRVDKSGLRQIMDWAVKGGILSDTISIDDFAKEFLESDSLNSKEGRP